MTQGGLRRTLPILAALLALGGGLLVARAWAGGAFDTSFSGDGRAAGFFPNEDQLKAVRAMRNGRILAVGSAGDPQAFAAARLRPGGTLDSNFGDGGRTKLEVPGSGDSVAYALTIQRDGKILLAGYGSQPLTDNDFAVARLHRNGAPDKSFSGDGVRTISFLNADGYDIARAVAVLPNGRILVSGSSEQPGSEGEFAIARLHRNGALDKTFSKDGRRLIPFGPLHDGSQDMAVRRDGRIVLVGYDERAGGEDTAVVRLLPRGALDPRFAGDGKRIVDVAPSGHDAAQAVALGGQGRILVGGYVRPGAEVDSALLRLRPGGALDTSFSGDGRRIFDASPGNNDFLYDIAIDRRRRIVAAGDAVRPATSQDSLVMRLRPNGAADKTFSGDGVRIIAMTPGAEFDVAFGVDTDRRNRPVVVGAFFDGSERVGYVIRLKR